MPPSLMDFPVAPLPLPWTQSVSTCLIVMPLEPGTRFVISASAPSVRASSVLGMERPPSECAAGPQRPCRPALGRQHCAAVHPAGAAGARGQAVGAYEPRVCVTDFLTTC